MYIFDGTDTPLSRFKEKGKVLIDKIKQLIGERTAELMMYSITEWASAYIVAREPEKIEQLAKAHQINIKKRDYNHQLYNIISKMVHEIDALIHNLTKQIKESQNENDYYAIVEAIEKASSVKEYLSDVMSKIEEKK